LKKDELIVVDFDGTLIDYSRRAFLAFKASGIAKLDVPINLEDYTRLRRQRISNYDLYTNLVGTVMERDIFERNWYQHIETENLLEKDELFADSIKWLDLVRHYADVILCSARRNQINLLSQISRLGIQDKFDYVLVASEPKRKSIVISDFLRSSSQVYNSIHFIGDTRNDMLEGAEIGAKLYFIERGFTLRDQVTDLKGCSIFRELPTLY
jgi:phosphoglycolate phosphatase-like HAD superfamily hydrolase